MQKYKTGDMCYFVIMWDLINIIFQSKNTILPLSIKLKLSSSFLLPFLFPFPKTSIITTLFLNHYHHQEAAQTHNTTRKWVDSLIKMWGIVAFISVT